MLLEYKKDENNQDILSSTDGVHQVMMEWEKPYMEKCIETLKPTGKVLEIGFGMGYSASEILKHNIDSYTVIECSPVVWKKFEEWKSSQRTDIEINLIKGRWEDVISTSGTYDSIFFDDYCHSVGDINRFFKFIEICLKYTLHVGSKVGFYSTNNIDDIEGDFFQITNNEFTIDIPKECNYARGTKMYIPIIKKTGDFNNSFKKKVNPTTFGKLAPDITLKAIKKYVPKCYNKCNLIVVDDLYNNVNDVRSYVLGQNGCTGNLQEELKNVVRTYIPENITYFSNEMSEYYTCDTLTRVTTYNDYDWCGIIFLSPEAPIDSSINFYKNKNTHDRYFIESDKTNMKDITNWELVDRVGNLYNRMVLFNCKRYHAHMNNFGDNTKNSKMFTMFLMKTGTT